MDKRSIISFDLNEESLKELYLSEVKKHLKNKTNGNLIISDNISAEKNIFKLKKELDSDGRIVLGIKNKLKITNVYVDELIKKQKSFVKLKSNQPDKDKEYQLKRFN